MRVRLFCDRSSAEEIVRLPPPPLEGRNQRRSALAPGFLRRRWQICSGAGLRSEGRHPPCGPPVCSVMLQLLAHSGSVRAPVDRRKAPSVFQWHLRLRRSVQSRIHGELISSTWQREIELEGEIKLKGNVELDSDRELKTQASSLQAHGSDDYSQCSRSSLSCTNR